MNAAQIIASEPCVTCGAQLDEKCKSESGVEFTFVHIARQEAARRAVTGGVKRKK